MKRVRASTCMPVSVYGRTARAYTGTTARKLLIKATPLVTVSPAIKKF